VEVNEWRPKEDINRVYKFLWKYANENKDFVTDPDDNRVRKALADSVLDRDLVVIAEDNEGTIRGILMTRKTKQWWSGKETIYNLVWYVEKPYRSLKLFRSFLDKAKKYAKINELSLTIEMPFTFDKTDKLEKAMNRFGFDKVGGLFKHG